MSPTPGHRQALFVERIGKAAGHALTVRYVVFAPHHQFVGLAACRAYSAIKRFLVLFTATHLCRSGLGQATVAQQCINGRLTATEVDEQFHGSREPPRARGSLRGRRGRFRHSARLLPRSEKASAEQHFSPLVAVVTRCVTAGKDVRKGETVVRRRAHDRRPHRVRLR